MEAELNNALGQTNFTTLDWIIVALYLSISVVIGLFVKKYVRNMATYLGAGRAVGTCLGIATMTGTEMGLITVMYSAQKGFTGGFAAFHIAVAAGIVTFVVGMTGFIVCRLRSLQVLTIPEFYEKRFDRKTRILGGIMLTLGGVLNMGLFLKVGSMFIVGITGLSQDSTALPIVMTTLLLLVLVYTVLGGMISVIITDYIQFVVLSVGLLVTTGFCISTVGWQPVFDTVRNLKGASGFNPLIEGGGFGVSYIMWMFFTAGLVSCAIWPTAVARALAMESIAGVKKQFMWSSVSFMIRFLVPYFWGICAFVFIMTEAPDLQTLFFPEDPNVDQVNNLYAMPVFLGRILPAGIIGIITAAMIAAFMSTHDSYLLCWSSVITQDIIAPLTGGKMSAKTRILLTRIFIVLIGFYILFWGLLYEGNDEIWDYMAVTGAIYFTGAFAVLLGGLYWKRASSTGAFFALLSGLTAILGLDPVQRIVGLKTQNPTTQEWTQQLTGDQIGLMTVAFSLTVLVIGSLAFPDKKPATANQ
ncbi:sodium:solute symporter family protein [bacterium]|jgi:solute:Na+ symporter, SSS family|nr:sodium:solute symporter family protein [Verrucomicrobiota bacterium]MDA7633775.1 sodium:solute symporter family protein [bacterium]MDA7866961.1 sodium:solute symporter family protein [Verrucomicrobiota bacterium]MDB4746384.1 sodium:solute symporter family protein [Verrucomicrobiota bacterium]